MNLEEAKVPNVEGDWQSIEIFLFSNGQQYSPPRKYHLRADDLSLWDATLNQLAQSHYGVQSPPINLYTIDGQLVEGPLELKDGQAYVAVAAPDTYIDAGYQKYLIRASRSWEKRQARRNFPECVPDEPCCLCPGQEWCCDPQACCLCPAEKEDTDVEPLLYATGHQNLRPAGGHFMSSAPAKLVTADNYGPRSGTIRSLAGEHDNMPGEYEASHEEYGHSPILAPTTPDESVSRFSKYVASPSERTPGLSENGSEQGKYRARLGEYGANQIKKTVRPNESEAHSDKQAAKLSENGATRGGNKPKLSENGASPVKYGSRDRENRARAAENARRLNEITPKLNKYGPKPREYDAALGENLTNPVDYEAQQIGQGLTPDKFGARLIDNEARPGEYEVNPYEHALKLSDNGAKPGRNEPRLSKTGALLFDYGARSTENGARPVENISRLNRNRPGLCKNETRQCDYDAALDENLAKPAPYGHTPILTENEARPRENGLRPSENRDRPVKYALVHSDKGERPGVKGPRLSKNGPGAVKSGVGNCANGARAAEHTSKLNENGSHLNKNGEKLSGYDNKSSAQVPKPGELRAISSKNGARLGENGIISVESGAKSSGNGVKPARYISKLSENRLRLSKNGTRGSEYEAAKDKNLVRLGECEAKPHGQRPRPGKFGAKLIENVSRPDKFAVKLIENVAKVNAPGKNGHSLRENGVRLLKYGAPKSENVAILSEYTARLNENEPMLSKNGAKQIEYASELSENVARPGECEARLSENGARITENIVPLTENEPVRARLSEYSAAVPSVNARRSCKYEFIPSEREAGLVEYETKVSIGGAPSEYRDRPHEYESRSSLNNTKVDEEWLSEEKIDTNKGPWISEIDPKREAFKIEFGKIDGRLIEGENRPDEDRIVDADKKYQYTTELQKQSSTLSHNIGENKHEKIVEHEDSESRQRDKEIEPKIKTLEVGGESNKAKMCCGKKQIRENDNVTEMDKSKLRKQQNGETEHTHGESGGQRGVDIQQEGSTGQSIQEFEHVGRVNAQKSRETNAAAGGWISGESGALLGEPNAQHRLGGRETKVGDHEARAGDLDFRTSDHDGGSGNPGFKEPVARTAVFGSGANPRDKINSRLRTYNLSQPKMGTPVITVDKTAARSDESEIKNGMGYSRARQNGVGGTGAARASHLSEAQHHARRTSLSARRQSTEKQLLSIGQDPSLLRKPTPISSVLCKTEENLPTKTNKDIFPKKIYDRVSASPLPAANDAGVLKPVPKVPNQRITQPTPPPLTMSQASLTVNTDLRENVINEKEIIVVSTNSFRDPESNIGSMRSDSIKHVVDPMIYSPEVTQTETIHVEKSTASGSEQVYEEAQTNTEAVEQHSQEVSAASEAIVNSCKFGLCNQCDDRLANVNPEDNNISIFNDGDVINLKLNIEVRNIVRSVYSCPKNCLRSRSFTNIMRSEKESQISLDENIYVDRNSLQSLLNSQHCRGYGFEGSPKVMVVQCAGCGRLNNPPRRGPPPCCDNNKKYIVLLSSSVQEDMDEICNFNPPCRPCDLRQSRKQSSYVPIKQAHSEMTLDTITTVTVSGVPLQKQETAKCMINASCQTEETQSVCMATKRKVSITNDSVPKSDDVQKKSNSSISVTTPADSLMPSQSCLKICPQKCEHQDSQVCLKFSTPVCPTICQKLQEAGSHVSLQTCPQECLTTCPQENLKTCPQVSLETCPQVSLQTCPQENLKICVEENSKSFPQENSQTCAQASLPKCPQVNLKTCPQVSLQTCPQVSLQTCPQVSVQTCHDNTVQSKGCQQTCPQVQSQACVPAVPPACPAICSFPLPCIQIQTQVSQQVPQVSDSQTQTRWSRIILQAHQHCDGHFSFHLPPLYVLHNYSL